MMQCDVANAIFSNGYMCMYLVLLRTSKGRHLYLMLTLFIRAFAEVMIPDAGVYIYLKE